MRRSRIPEVVNAATIASRTRGASASSDQANIDGPAPEMVQPSAPLAIAPARTASKPGMSCDRCFSMTTSSNEARITSRSFE